MYVSVYKRVTIEETIHKGRILIKSVENKWSGVLLYMLRCPTNEIFQKE